MRKLLLALYATLTVTACVPIRPIPPPQPQPSDPLQVAVTVRTEDGGAVPGLTCVLVPDTAPPSSCRYTPELRALWLVPDNLNFTGGEIRLSADGYQTLVKRVLIQPELGDETLYSNKITLPKWVPVGKYFRTDTNEPITVIGATDFNLLARYINGQDIEPVLAQRRDAGFNLLRVFTAFDICPSGEGCQQLGRLYPEPKVYSGIAGFGNLTAKYGFHIEFVAFTGPYNSFFPNDDTKVQHWESIKTAVCALPNAMLEMVNEGTHSANKNLPWDRLSRPPIGCISSHGSGEMDGEPVMPLWNYGTYHPGQGPEWMRKTAHNAMEDVADKYGAVAVSNENMRSPDNDRRDEHFFDAAAGAALLSAGATFHSVHGKNSTLWDDTELSNARAWAAGAKSVPLACQGQPYARIDDPNYLRVYARGSDPACVVRIRR